MCLFWLLFFSGLRSCFQPVLLTLAALLMLWL